jgi:hypothetical protein
VNVQKGFSETNTATTLAAIKIQSTMFQRQSRKSFPATYIVILAAAVLGILFFILKGMNKAEPQPTEPPVEQTENQ